jgi:hypothetical protein
MIKPKTHFEQVPIKLVEDIIGNQAGVGGFAAVEMDVPELTAKPATVKGSFERPGTAKRLRKERD